MLQAADFAVKHVVIGAGVVGLAVAARLSKEGSTIILEKNPRIGEETSSRNSEVVHAGLYYPPDSLKTKLCIKGKKLLYKLCEKNGIPVNQCGKWVIALNQEEIDYLATMKQKAQKLNVPLDFLPHKEIKEKEPHVKALEALYSPTTGIVDSHSVMLTLHGALSSNGGEVMLNSKVFQIQRQSLGKYLIEAGTEEERAVIGAEAVINCAGLHASHIAALLIGKIPDHYVTHFCKGHYFGYSGAPLVKRLIYPVPEKNLAGLGVHATIDLAGRMRFGPDTLYIDNNTDYSVNPNYLDKIHLAVTRYLPSVERDKLYPDYAGIRPKLSAQGQPARDFLIEEESERGFPGFVNLLGIESPGLTSSLAIAEMVAGKLNYKEYDVDNYPL